MQKPTEKVENKVVDLYKLFTQKQVSDKIAEIVTPDDFESEVEIIFQTVDDLHKACPDHKGDWYFTGDFPTPGGNRITNRSFIYFMENNSARAY